MKKILAYGGLILLFLLLQCSFFVHLSLADVVPNLLIILTASIAIINGSLEGCLVGFCCGLLLDLMFGPYIGMYAFGYMLCGYLTGIGNRFFLQRGFDISRTDDCSSRSVLWILYVCFRFYDQRQIECIVLFAEDYPAGSCLYSDYRCFPLSNYITDNRALREKRK